MKLTNYSQPKFINTKLTKKIWSKKDLFIVNNKLTNRFEIYKFKKTFFQNPLTFHLNFINSFLTFQESKDFANELLID